MRRLHPSPPPPTADLSGIYRWPDERCLRVNFVSSVDGAASVDGRSGTLGGAGDRAVFTHLRATCDVVLVGAGTAKAENYRPASIPVAVVSARLSPSPDERLFHPQDGTVRPLILTCASAPADRRAALAAHAEVVDCGEQEVDPHLIVDQLERRGFLRILCEGGPRLFGDLLAADVVDELCLTLAPLLVAGDASRIANGALLARPKGVRLLTVLEDEGSLLLHYSLRRSR